MDVAPGLAGTAVEGGTTTEETPPDGAAGTATTFATQRT
jgi:hypothetical protein